VQLFVDNDILLKLASTDLLHNLNTIFNVNDSSIFILPSAKFYISKSKNVRRKYSIQTINKVLNAIKVYSIIPDIYIDQNKFFLLSNISNIDSGEQLLYSLNPPSNDFLVLTGDKLSIHELFSNINLKGLSQNLYHKIVCLEYLFLMIIALNNFEELTHNIKSSNYCGDKTIQIVFQQNNLTVDLAVDGLISYFKDLNKQTNDSLFFPKP